MCIRDRCTSVRSGSLLRMTFFSGQPVTFIVFRRREITFEVTEIKVLIRPNLTLQEITVIRLYMPVVGLFTDSPVGVQDLTV